MGENIEMIKTAQLGLKTVCIEKRGSLGRTCLNVGCIQSKTLLNIFHKYHDMLHAKYYELICDKPTYDWSVILNKKERVIKGLTKEIEYLFKKNQIDYIKEKASSKENNSLKVVLNEGKEEKNNK